MRSLEQQKKMRWKMLPKTRYYLPCSLLIGKLDRLLQKSESSQHLDVKSFLFSLHKGGDCVLLNSGN